MSWRGIMRSAMAAHRRAQREAERDQRVYEREQEHLQRIRDYRSAEQEVDEYDNYINNLRSIHAVCSMNADWEACISKPEPQCPCKRCECEEVAQNNLDSYQPSFFDKLFNKVPRQLECLNTELANGMKQDEVNYRYELDGYNKEHEQWVANRKMADKILNGDRSCYKEAIEESDIFGWIEGYLKSVKMDFSNEYYAIVDMKVHEEENVVPGIIKKLLKTNRVSYRNMPKIEYYKLYCDYACGCVLRIAHELYSFLPRLTMMVITADCEILNKKTGHKENASIISAAIPRDTLSTLYFKNIDPSLAMDNFIHNIEFKKTSGFAPVEKLNPSEFESK